MKLSEIVKAKRVNLDLKSTKKDDVLKELVELLKLSNPASETLLKTLRAREELGSTGIGKGVAVPHTKHPSVDKLVATIALSKDGVEFASLDGESVHILFLLVSPPDRPGDHLRALENISRHLRNDNFCNFLRQALSAQAVIELLEEADNNQLG